MRWSATRLRWLLLAGAVLLSVAVAGFFGLARYRAGKIWQRILARNGVNLHRETNGFTWSQSSKGRTVFTLHASKATPEGHNKWALHDAVLILYGREPGQDDRIYGSEFHYDGDAGVAKAAGEVHMDLRAPQSGQSHKIQQPSASFGFGLQDEASADPNVIHVRTSGLTYMRKLGIAATGEMAEFRYGGVTCTSHGAEFDSEHSLLRLLADVHMNGTLRGSPFQLASAHVELDRDANTANLANPVLTSGMRSARAATALLHLRKDGSLQGADANGAVQLRSATELLGAPMLTATFGTNSEPQAAHLGNGVTFSDTDAARPAQGKARTLDLAWNAAGQLNTATGTGAVEFSGTERDRAGAPSQRHMRAETVEATFASPGGQRRAQLRHAHLVGNAELGSSRQGGTSGPAVAETLVAADELDSDFAAEDNGTGRLHAQSLRGEGHTRLNQTAENGARQTSTADTLTIAFAPPSGAGPAEGGEGSLRSARQSGHVEIQTWTAPKAGSTVGELTTAHAAGAEYTGADQVLVLTSDAPAQVSLQQPGGSLQASRVTVHQATGDLEAEGGVTATSLAANGGTASHVLSTRARFQRNAELSFFTGEAGRPVQLWQGGSQVQAGEISMDGKAHTMAARPGNSGGLVRGVFATAVSRERPRSQQSVAGKGKASESFGRSGGQGVIGQDVPEAERNSIAVSASRLDFDEQRHEAVFAGGVRMTGSLGEVTGERGVAFLRAPGTRAAAGQNGRSASGQAEASTLPSPDLSGSLDRLVMLGDVHVRQPGREGTGEQLTYTAATNSFALTGTPSKAPRIAGEQGSVITGDTLLFRGSDSTIVVAGAKGEGRSAGSGRVHTETDLKQ